MEMRTAYQERTAPITEQSIYYIDKPKVQAGKVYFLVKRIFDFCFSLLGIIILLVPMLIIAMAVIIDSPGNPIFKQERVGKNGKPFVIYKFRSMYLDAEENGPCWAESNDARCTKLGIFMRRTRLDELPQIYNILRGDMSFVGPRPERAYFYRKFEEYIKGFSNRLMVTPGLTGYAQVNGGYNLTPEEKIIYDMEYINKQSIIFDLKCIAKTVILLFTRKVER